MDIGSLMTNRISGSTFWFPSSDCAAQNTHPISQNNLAPSGPSPSNDLIFSGDEVRLRSVAVPRSTTRTLKKSLHVRMYYFQLVLNFEGNRRSDGHFAPQKFRTRSTGIFLSYRLHICQRVVISSVQQRLMFLKILRFTTVSIGFELIFYGIFQ